MTTKRETLYGLEMAKGSNGYYTAKLENGFRIIVRHGLNWDSITTYDSKGEIVPSATQAGVRHSVSADLVNKALEVARKGSRVRGGL